MVLFAPSTVFVAPSLIFVAPSTVFVAPVHGLISWIDGLICQVGGLICSREGLIYSTDGFIYSTEARNWWIGAIACIGAVNITFCRAPETVAEPALCCKGAKLTFARPGKRPLLPKFVIDSAPRSFSGAKNIVDRANKTINRVNKTIGGRRRCSGSGANCPRPQRMTSCILVESQDHGTQTPGVIPRGDRLAGT